MGANSRYSDSSATDAQAFCVYVVQKWEDLMQGKTKSLFGMTVAALIATVLACPTMAAEGEDGQDMGRILDGDTFRFESPLSVPAGKSFQCFRDRGANR